LEKSGKTRIQDKITKLLNSIISTPETGIGKPEKLKGNLSGLWAQRINEEHRIVYQVDYFKQMITIFSLRGHY
jgi:toxin YoeB